MAWWTGVEGTFLAPQEAWGAFTGQLWADQRGHGWLDAVRACDRADLLRTLRAPGATDATNITDLWNASSRAYARVRMSWKRVPRGEAGAEWIAIAVPQGLNDDAAATSRVQAVELDFEQFSSIAAHDLREPIRGISSYAGFLLEDYGEVLGEAGKGRLETIIRLGGRLNGLLDAVAVYGSLRRASIRRRPTNLGDLAQRAAALTTRGAANVVVQDSMPRVDCDGELILDVLGRLIDNGLKFNESPRQQVVISWEADPNDADKCVIVVQDNGIGIRENHMAVLFRMFKRLNSREAFGGGLGVGLAISRKIVELHGGRMWIKSQFGHGTTVYFTLQRAGAEARHG